MPTCLYLKDEGTMQDGVRSEGMEVGEQGAWSNQQW